MKQKNTLQWLSIVAGKTKLLVGVLVAIQAVLSVSSIAFAFVLRRIINMAVQGAPTGFRAAFVLLASVIAAQIALGAAGRFLSEYTSAAVENRFKHRLFSALLFFKRESKIPLAAFYFWEVPILIGIRRGILEYSFKNIF